MKATKQRRAGDQVSPSPLVIERVSPELDGGRHPVKRLVNDAVRVRAAVFKDGHDLLAARVRYRGPGDATPRYVALTYDQPTDYWYGEFTVDRIGDWSYTIEGWTDRFGTWQRDLEKKLGAGQEVHLELREGAELLDATARRTRFGDARTALARAAATLRDESAPQALRGEVGLSPQLAAIVRAYYIPNDLAAYRRELVVAVDRERAGFAAWYEFFPRSQGRVPGEHGTFATAAEQLPRIAALGFDVVYLPPIHPIGYTFRKGRNNSLEASPDDVGSPWAIGNEEGGHTAVEPRLGTIDDFDRFVARAAELGMEVALDYALQCSPDHPWVREHPDWFNIRPDGSIQYAENPPKKYQDIYPLNFWTADRAALWEACRDVILFWVGHGVKTFRVDNPHTKPFSFWEWCIAEVRREHPDVVFLAEAFTRPHKLLNLAKLGFQQSYGYFTWKNSAHELRQWIQEFFLDPEVREYHRGNLFANTPDILHAYLQHGGRPAFRTRLLLATTLSPVYGIYSGYELCENVPVRPGSEEYLDSEKYEVKFRDFDAPGNINDDVRRLNELRRTERALHRADNLTLVHSENEQIFAYLKSGGADAASLLVVANLDPHHTHATVLHVPLGQLGLGDDEPYVANDLLTGARYHWRGARNFVQLDPRHQAGHVLRIER